MKRILSGIAAVLIAGSAAANNLSIDNVELTGQNPTGGYVFVEFDLSWDNSWAINVGPKNWDAAWVFVKFRANASEVHHATLNYVDGTAAGDGHTEVAGSRIRGASDQVGVFIRRDSIGTGTNDFDNLRLRWNYAADGVGDTDEVGVSVHGIEMVYVPGGPFQLGSGGTELNAWYTYPDSNTPYQVTGPGPIPLGETNGYLYSEFTSATTNEVASTFPNGYLGFYCMKYEISQGQWTDFLNKLTPVQVTNGFITAAENYAAEPRITVSFDGVDTWSTTTPDRAMGEIRYTHLLTYLDWTGLRPMTEFEFEKACRGPGGNPNEYAWGDTSISTNDYVITGDGTPSATVNAQTGTGNALYDEVDDLTTGPYRCGIFAASRPNPSRRESGASFYGIMELSGNVREHLVDHIRGPTFTRVWGDGEISPLGRHNEGTNYSLPILTDKGGSFFDSAELLQISRRPENIVVSSYPYVGGRGVRSYP